MDSQLLDINTVCNMLGTTSRTLRFYEEKKIISSTRTPYSPRRRYTPDQIERIQIVLVLRSLGLSVNEICKLGENDGSLREALEKSKAKITAKISEMIKTLNLLNGALASIDYGENILKYPKAELTPPNTEFEKTVRICTEAIINDDTETLYGFLTDNIQSYMPEEAYKSIRADTLKPLGSFIDYGKIEPDTDLPNVIFQYVRFEKSGLRIKYVFHHGKIHGLWLNYCEM